MPNLNGWFGEIRCVAKSVPPQPQTNAASAAWPNVNVGKVRILPVLARCSERHLILDLPFIYHAAKARSDSFLQNGEWPLCRLDFVKPLDNQIAISRN